MPLSCVQGFASDNLERAPRLRDFLRNFSTFKTHYRRSLLEIIQVRAWLSFAMLFECVVVWSLCPWGRCRMRDDWALTRSKGASVPFSR